MTFYSGRTGGVNNAKNNILYMPVVVVVLVIIIIAAIIHLGKCIRIN
jgi:hypothetical protein